MISIVAAFAVPSIQCTMTAYRLTSSANLVAEELDAAGVLAIPRSAVYEVRFTDRVVSVIAVEDVGDPPRAPKVFEPGVRVAVPPSSGVRFFPRGYAQGGDLILENQGGSLIRMG